VETSISDLYEQIATLMDSPLRPQFEALRPGDVPRSVLDPSKAKSVLGWEPWTALDEGLTETINWFRKPH
jgi:UDP-glucose 4-epimerase